MAWTEVGLCPSEYPDIARELKSSYRTWPEVDEIILRDVIGSFAIESALFPLALVPIVGLLLITPFPDWGYEKSYLQERMSRWYRVPRWRHYLNPIRLVGYPIAYVFALGVRLRLKAAYLRETA